MDVQVQLSPNIQIIHRLMYQNVLVNYDIVKR